MKLMVSDPRLATEPEQVLKDAFSKTQSCVKTANMSGTTATVVLHNHEQNTLIVGHCGDCTCCLGKRSGGDWTALPLTVDHKPDLREERQRIEMSGGRVVFDGYANHRVYAKGKPYPGLNMSRALGDLIGEKDAGISAEPTVSDLVRLTEEDRLLIICSDGVWEFITAQQAVQMA